MKKHIYTFITLITVFSLVSCGNKKDKNQAMNSGQPQATPVVSVKIQTGDYTTFKSYPTSIEGINNSEARPKVSGYITEVLVDEGQKVKRGQMLFKLETASLSEQAQAVKANINTAQVKVDQLKPLVEKNIVSESQLNVAKAQLQQAKSNYHSVMADINYANVKSPVDGYVGTIRIRKGNLVSPSDPKPLTTVSKIDKVYAYFTMNEREYLDFLKTAKGKTKAEKIENMPKVTLVMANGEVYKHKGIIQTINSQVDKQTGTVSFRVMFENPEFILTNGSTGKIEIPQTYKDIIAVPQKSTYEQQGYVYVKKIIKTDTITTVTSQVISVKDKTQNVFLVEDGIKKGEEIVAEGAAAIRPGTPVKPMLQPFDSVAKPIPVLFE